MLSLNELVVGARFLRRLPRVLRRPMTLHEARLTLEGRLARREADFLATARRAIYAGASHPYRELLALAGCEYGDLERLVRHEGLDGALRALFRRGVYLTLDEFKGRRPAVRGSATVAVDPTRLLNAAAIAHLPSHSSGSRSAATPIPMDLAAIQEVAVNQLLALDARGGTGWRFAIWGVPGGSGMRVVLRSCAFGVPPDRWFSQVDPAAPGLHWRYRWSLRVMRWGSLVAGVPLPRARHVPIEQPRPIVRWMAEVLRSGDTPHVNTFASSAVRLCEAAMEHGIGLEGAQFTVTGEPTTATRLAVIRRAGAEAVPSYASSECGRIGYGCLRPEAPDDVHLFHDFHGVIQPGADADGTGLPAQALLMSTLRPSVPFILLNVSLGDQAVMAERRCGCPLEAIGWAMHLHGIRSFEKLTGGGMTFHDTDVIRVLEQVLPARFGGGPTHYQLVEEEASDGRPRLRLLVHPALGPLDPRAIADVFFTAIGAGSGVERVMELRWRQDGLLRVERRAPLTTRTGKILHLHVEARAAADASAPPAD